MIMFIEETVDCYGTVFGSSMPAEEWTSEEADPYQAPDDPDNWEDEAE